MTSPIRRPIGIPWVELDGTDRRPVMWDTIVGDLLGQKPGHPRVRAFQRALRAALVTEVGRSDGLDGLDGLDSKRALVSVVGDRAVAHISLALDSRPLRDAAFKTAEEFADVPEAHRRRWREPPLRAYEKSLFNKLVSFPFVVARVQNDAPYEPWWFFEFALRAFGVHHKSFAAPWGRHGQWFEVLCNDGYVHRVLCVREVIMLDLLCKLSTRPRLHANSRRVLQLLVRCVEQAQTEGGPIILDTELLRSAVDAPDRRSARPRRPIDRTVS